MTNEKLLPKYIRNALAKPDFPRLPLERKVERIMGAINDQRETARPTPGSDDVEARLKLIDRIKQMKAARKRLFDVGGDGVDVLLDDCWAALEASAALGRPREDEVGRLTRAATAVGSILDDWIKIVGTLTEGDLHHYAWRRAPTYEEVQEAMRANNELRAALGTDDEGGAE